MTNNHLTLGSLFDGSGGFPLAGALCGIEPRWASEVEPYPIAVTKTHFPHMKHLGDIKKVNGAEIEPVDIIAFGSPCQDLSVAGKRAGLKHTDNGDEETTRSGLFMEAVRIIKEMRSATNETYPRFALWENVPGAFSSNKGEDFRVVLEELIHIVEPTAIMPAVPKNGWSYADSYVGDGWSLAYRVLDAQYWGVPQRRRRIYLVLDLGGECARKVLFERESLRGYFETVRTPWQGAAADAEGGVGAGDRDGKILSFHLTQDPITSDRITPCISSGNSASGQSCVGVVIGFDGYNGDITGDKSSTLGVNCGLSSGRNGVAFCYDARGNGDGKTVNTITGDHNNRITDYSSVVVDPVVPIHDQATRFVGKRGEKADGKGNGLGVGAPGDPMNTLTGGDRHAVVYALDRASFNQGANARYDFEITDNGINSTIVSRGPSAVCYSTGHGSFHTIAEEGICATLQASDYKDPPTATYRYENRYVVRRLTPTECTRLQGFPDTWGDVDPKDAFSEEEYRFWLEVRNTHATINDRAVKKYNAKQMVSWYNKLRTDSAEYKMWGNGIALPTALYVVQGIADAMTS